jgi:hypothetical protein
MTTMNDTLFGSLGKQYCIYFYLLSVFGFILLAMTMIGMVWSLFTKKLDMKVMTGLVMASLGYGIFYFQNRLLHSMCVQEGLVNNDGEQKPKHKTA